MQLETSSANEKHIESKAGALCVEIARQETLFSSMQRIESSLMAKAKSEVENLQVELKHVQESKPDDDTKHDATVIKLGGKIANLERIVKDLRLSSRLPRRS